MTTFKFTRTTSFVKSKIPPSRRKPPQHKRSGRQRAPLPTWPRMCDLEYGFTTLESELRRCRPPGAAAFERRWAGYQARLRHYAGKFARRPQLRSERIYEIVHQRLRAIYESRGVAK